jgi:hypothetical protein
MAACAHVWHYKCISRLIHSRDYPMFQCPNCRVWTDLNAEVDDTVDLEEENQTELESKLADAEDGNDTTTTQDDSATAEEQRPSGTGQGQASRDAAEANDLVAIVENMDLEDRSTPMQDGENPDSGNNSTAETGTPSESRGRSANIPIPASSGLRLRPPSPDSYAPDNFEDNPMTPRNDTGPLALDGRTGRF